MTAAPPTENLNPDLDAGAIGQPGRSDWRWRSPAGQKLLFFAAQWPAAFAVAGNAAPTLGVGQASSAGQV